MAASALYSALYIALFFTGLGLATSLLVAVHDHIEALLERRSLRSLPGGGEGGIPLPLPATAPRAPRRLPLPRPALAQASPLDRANERPMWLDVASRDVAHR